MLECQQIWSRKSILRSRTITALVREKRIVKSGYAAPLQRRPRGEVGQFNRGWGWIRTDSFTEANEVNEGWDREDVLNHFDGDSKPNANSKCDPEFEMRNADSAEKPHAIKNHHLKTPPKGGVRFKNVAHIESWSEILQAFFRREIQIPKPRGFSAESNATI